MQTKEQALAALKAKCAPTKEPVLSDPDIERILEANARYIDYPAAGQTVEIDTRVRPTGSRRVYKCIRGGVIGTALSLPLETGIKSIVTDGTATWQDVGPAHAQRYDINGAAHDAWMEKSAQAAENYNFSEPGQRVEAKQIWDNCVAMAGRYEKVFVV